MKNYLNHYLLLLKRLLLVYGVFFVCRLIFYVFNNDQLSDSNGWEILQSFLAGFIFDTSAIVYIFGFFILLHVLPLPFRDHKWYQQMEKGYFFFMLAGSVLFNLIDVGYFPFNGRRSGIEVFAPMKDISDQTMSYLISYWYLLVLWMAILYGAYLFYPELKRFTVPFSWKKLGIELLLLPVAAGLCVLGARGGLGLKPIAIFDAARFAHVKLVALTLNTPFQLLITSQLSDLEEVAYMSPVEAEKIFSPVHKPKSIHVQPRNIVLLIMESMGKEYVGYYNSNQGYTPFLDSLMQHSLVYRNAYANGKRSIEGIPAIIAAMPSVWTSSYINTRFQTNNLRGIGSYLAELGYETSFYHGCKNGTMGFNNFVAVTGSGRYSGMDEYPDKQRDYDGHWGIYDEPYLQFVAREIDHMQPPFFTTIFTQSSHHPYPIPAHQSGMFAKGSLPIHRSVRYTDFSLRMFMQAAAAKPWYSNTLFIITADHSAENETPYYQSQQGKYAIPLFVFDPSNPVHREESNTVQQTDLMPMILDSIYPKSYFAFSNFGTGKKGFAIQYLNGYYQLIQWPWVYQFDGQQAVSLYHITSDSLMNKNRLGEKEFRLQEEEMKKLIQSYIQQYNHRIIHNTTIIP